MAGVPGEEAAAVRRSLDQLNATLDAVRRGLSSSAKPPIGDLEAAGRKALELRTVLEAAMASAERVPESERVELLRAAGAARAKLALVAQLAAGGARFAAITRELAGEPRGGIYGREGAGSASAKQPSVERKV